MCPAPTLENAGQSTGHPVERAGDPRVPLGGDGTHRDLFGLKLEDMTPAAFKKSLD